MSVKMKRPAGKNLMSQCHLLAKLLASLTLLLPVAACKTSQSDTESAALTTDEMSEAKINIDEGTYPLVTGPAAGFQTIAKRIMGIDPQQGTPVQPGLANLADTLGYQNAFDDQKKGWAAASDQDGAVTISVAAEAGKAPSAWTPKHIACPRSSVKYSFKDWVVDGGVTKQLDFKQDMGAIPSGTPPPSNVKSLPPQISFDKNSMLAVGSEVARIKSVEEDYSPELSVIYERNLAPGHRINLLGAGNDAPGGITLLITAVSGKADTPESHKFAISKGAPPPQSSTSKISCRATIKTIEGCGYELSIAAKYVVAQKRYRGFVKAKPRILGLDGFLGVSKDCQNKQHRVRSGFCNCERFEETFGDETETFAEDLADRFRKGDGHWYWENLSKLSPKNDKPGIDLVRNYLNSGDYDRFAVDFVDLKEYVEECVPTVKVIKGSKETCQVEAELETNLPAKSGSATPKRTATPTPKKTATPTPTKKEPSEGGAQEFDPYENAPTK